VLVTTTILERGVTIPKSDVYILDANNPLFDEASLVQMAGRAGRSGADPAGFVFYGAPTWTNAQRNSIRQIRRMNAIARRKGYLHANA
jgi:late competence protein required for DNA uptake (superfamily II DNA/RNA helicase)